MNLLLSQSPLLKPARFLWRRLIKLKPVHRYFERHLIYPDLPHIKSLGTQSEGPPLLAGLFSSNLGLGEAARLELAKQQSDGLGTIGVDISSAFGLSDRDLPEGVVSREKAPRQGPLILHCNAPEAGRALQYLGKELTEHRYIIGYWAWELEMPPHDWELAYKYFDELWVLSNHTAKAFCASPVPVSVHPPVVQRIVDGGHSFLDLGLPDLSDKTVFLCMADGRSDLARKNIAGTVHAFVTACGKCTTAALIVKLHHTEFAGSELKQVQHLSEQYENVHLIDSCFTTAQRNSLLHRVQAVISLHRAEGYGLLLAEAKSLGKKIIATAYSAPMDFLDESIAELVPYSLISVQGDTANYSGYANAVWAEPDKDAAANAISLVLKQCTNF